MTKTKLYDWGNVYRLTVAESVIYNEKEGNGKMAAAYAG